MIVGFCLNMKTVYFLGIRDAYKVAIVSKDIVSFLFFP